MLVISQHFDWLVREIDIFIEEQLKKCAMSDPAMKIPKIRPTTTEFQKETQNDSDDDDDNEISLLESQDDIWKYGRKKIWDQYEMLKDELPTTKIRNTQNESTVECVMKKASVLNRARNEMLAELANAEKDALRRYDAMKMAKLPIKKVDEFASDREYIEVIKSHLFAEKFYMLVRKSESTYKLHLLELDFYLSQNQREFLR